MRDFCVIFMHPLKMRDTYISILFNFFVMIFFNKKIECFNKKNLFSKQTTIVKRESKKRTIVKTDIQSHFGL